MRFYTKQHKFSCGIDLHAKTMYLCILNQEGKILLHRDIKTDPDIFLKTIAPYREDIVIAVECIFTWYWLADLCSKENIPFVLGHALYMKAIHGGKAKNDKIDAYKIAALLRGGMMPMAYVYPSDMRSTPESFRDSGVALTSQEKGLSSLPISKTPITSITLPIWEGSQGNATESK